MSAAELQRIGKRLYGGGWQGKLAAAIGVHRTTVMRWAKNERPIPKPAILAIRALS